MIQFSNVSYTYPFQDQKAVENISFDVSPGEAVLFTGASGSGKSTLIRLINGLAPHYYKGALKGEIRVSGKNTAGQSIQQISQTVGTMFQDPEHQFFALNVAEELAFALECHGKDPQTITQTVKTVSEWFRLEEIMDSVIFDLSEGEKQKLALASILAFTPRIIILDEPSANLDPAATTELAGHLLALKKRGITLLIVDHRLYWLRDLIDTVMVLENGRIEFKGSFSKLDDPAIRERFGLRATQIGKTRMTRSKLNSMIYKDFCIHDLTFGFKSRPPLFENACFSLPRGEVIAITGKNGTGKTTFARLITGLLPLKNGDITANGNRFTPRQLLRKGSIVLQNTDHQLHMKTVRQELELAGRKSSKERTKEMVDRLLEGFGLFRFENRHPQSLSGGQKQRLVIASALVKEPDILILDEPTSGLDGINMNIISDIIKKLARSGTLVMVITHDLELIDRACTHELALPLKITPFDTKN